MVQYLCIGMMRSPRTPAAVQVACRPQRCFTLVREEVAFSADEAGCDLNTRRSRRGSRATEAPGLRFGSLEEDERQSSFFELCRRVAHLAAILVSTRRQSDTARRLMATIRPRSGMTSVRPFYCFTRKRCALGLSLAVYSSSRRLLRRCRERRP